MLLGKVLPEALRNHNHHPPFSVDVLSIFIGIRGGESEFMILNLHFLLPKLDEFLHAVFSLAYFTIGYLACMTGWFKGFFF